MKTAKRLLALALAGVMALALLTGCSDSSSKAKQVEEYFRYMNGGYTNYQKDETLDKKLEVIAQKFQPSWLDDKNGELTNDAQIIIKNELKDYLVTGGVNALGRRSEAGPERAGAGGEYEVLRDDRDYSASLKSQHIDSASHSLYNDGQEE